MEFISQKEYEELKNDPIKLFSIINQIDNEEKQKQAMIEINNEGSIDICEFVVNAIEGGANVFSVIALMRDIIEKLRLNKKSLLNYFRIINQSLQENMLNYLQYTQIKNITIYQPDFAHSFMEYLSAANEPFVYQYIVEIILSLENFEIAEKHSRLLSMANSDVEARSICGINGLGRLNYNAEQDHELIHTTLVCFESLIKQEPYVINGAITKSLYFLYSLGDQIISRLVELSKRDDPYIMMQIAQFLRYEYNNIHTQDYFGVLLFSLAKVNSNYMGIIKELDMLFFNMINTESHVDI
jgi:hypothetical protein